MELAEIIDEARQIAEELEKPFHGPSLTGAELARLARCVEALARRADTVEDTVFQAGGDSG
jgi:hypothetical protein